MTVSNFWDTGRDRVLAGHKIQAVIEYRRHGEAGTT
jgi:hypothetical protein